MTAAPRWVPNLAVSSLLERFLIAAAAAFLLIRSYLALTNYPQIGGHGLHIAHMLWGGLGMLVAVVLLVSFLGDRVRFAAAFIGGAGFGTFIDELGKFITSDNDYFFQPTVAIIYLIFIALFLAFQAIQDRRVQSDAARLAQGLDAVVSAVIRGFDGTDRTRALAALAAVPQSALAQGIAGAIAVLPESSPSVRSWRDRFMLRVAQFYDQAIRSRLFFVFAVVVMGLQALTNLGNVIYEIVRDPAFSLTNPHLSFGDIVKIAAGLVSSVFVVIGLVTLPRARAEALQWFKRGLLIAILVLQLFSFYAIGLVAVGSLAVSLLLLVIVNVAISEEASIAGA